MTRGRFVSCKVRVKRELVSKMETLENKRSNIVSLARTAYAHDVSSASQTPYVIIYQVRGKM